MALLFAHSMMSRLSSQPDANGRNLAIAGWKIWEWDLRFQMGMGMGWDGNEVIEVGRNWYEKSVPAHLYLNSKIPQL